MTPQEPPRVIDVLASIHQDPVLHLIRNWNWKTGLISFGWRGTIFLAANMTAGIGAGFRALLIEACYRPAMSGWVSALTQAFRFAVPAWQANVVVAVVLPVLSHGVEFGIHRLCGTERVGTGVAFSMAFTVVSCIAELAAMRRGILVIGESSRPLSQDLQIAFHELRGAITDGLRFMLRTRAVRASAQ
jgi:hypothetical protein